MKGSVTQVPLVPGLPGHPLPLTLYLPRSCKVGLPLGRVFMAVAPWA